MADKSRVARHSSPNAQRDEVGTFKEDLDAECRDVGMEAWAPSCILRCRNLKRAAHASRRGALKKRVLGPEGFGVWSDTSCVQPPIVAGLSGVGAGPLRGGAFASPARD